MSRLTPLLEVQDLDQSSDRLAAQRLVLPERERLREAEAAIAFLATAHADLATQKRTLAEAERTLAGEVAAMAARAKEVETTLYGGTVRHSKELSALQEEMQTLRLRQGALETRELVLLESIDRAEAQIAENRSEHAAWTDHRVAGEAALAVAERAIDFEIAGLEAQRRTRMADLPEAILAAYAKLRSRARFAGRAVARIVDGGCTGCHMRLPVNEHHQMLAQPDDALLVCVHCGRILVRSEPVAVA